MRRGDTLSAIFDRLQLTPQELGQVVRSGKDAKALNRLQPGQMLRFSVAEGKLLALRYEMGADAYLEVTRSDGGWSASVHQTATETRVNYARGVIESSLYLAGLNAGLPESLIMEMVGIFGWDIDFALDIRQGDSFTAVYEEHFLNGEKLRDGAIIAAEFVNQGRVYRAVRYTDANSNSGYYTPEGRSVRKAFIRSPVDFRRISSRFQRERYHPVLGKKRPHRGVDYAAATGTPIKAAGDGKIIFRGRKGGYGNTIILQHGGRITTVYAHMSKFRGGMRVGSRVRQGQIIGYVGKTGLATGPHLHYEFRVNGSHRNPLTVRLPQAEPIRAEYRQDFLQHSQGLLAQLDVLSRTRLALVR